MHPALLVLTALLGPVPGSSAQEPSRYDVVIRGGRVLDGTGNPFFHADVAIDDGRIVLIGKVPDVTVFGPVTIRNRSTYARPHAYSEGVRNSKRKSVEICSNNVFRGATRGRGRLFRAVDEKKSLVREVCIQKIVFMISPSQRPRESLAHGCSEGGLRC